MIENKNFGEALEALKQGKRVARHGWNGKGMFVFCLPSIDIHISFLRTHNQIPVAVQRFFESIDKGFVLATSYLVLYADGSIVTGWLASQTDMLANDWCILD